MVVYIRVVVLFDMPRQTPCQIAIGINCFTRGTGGTGHVTMLARGVAEWGPGYGHVSGG